MLSYPDLRTSRPWLLALAAATISACGAADSGRGAPQPATPGAANTAPSAPTSSATPTEANGQAPSDPAAAAATPPPPAASTAPNATAPPKPPPPTGPCPEDMVDVSVACIDRYEAPNQAGDKPLLMQSVPDAEAWCEARGKRLCTEDEWLRACRGPKGWRHPYGPKYQAGQCNDDKTFRPPRWKVLHRWPADEAKKEAQRLDQSEPSGARSTCVSAEGVYDLTGNAAEWVVKTRRHPEACLKPAQAKHKHVVQGCYWGRCYRPPHLPVCDYVNCSHASGFRSYEFGFRCCKDPKR